jgi:hypothetical protein
MSLQWKLMRASLRVTVSQSAPAMKYTVWANGIFMPDYFYAKKQNKEKTHEPPVAPPKVIR